MKYDGSFTKNLCTRYCESTRQEYIQTNFTYEQKYIKKALYYYLRIQLVIAYHHLQETRLQRDTKGIDGWRWIEKKVITAIPREFNLRERDAILGEASCQRRKVHPRPFLTLTGKWRDRQGLLGKECHLCFPVTDNCLSIYL